MPCRSGTLKYFGIMRNEELKRSPESWGKGRENQRSERVGEKGGRIRGVRELEEGRENQRSKKVGGRENQRS